MQIPERSYGVDVSSFQDKDLSKYVGSKFALVKITQGTNYININAKGQIASAKANGMLPMAYHFATFGASVSRAKSEAKYALNHTAGLSKGSYIACDWETGEGNDVTSGKKASATAVLVFMKVIKDAGYKPLLYSGASLLRNNIDSAAIVKKYGTCLWVASYATEGRIDKPNFNYFPSMNGVAIWQFTDNWRGLSVDGNISLIKLEVDSIKTSKWVKNPGTFTLGQALKIHKSPHIDAPAIAKLQKGAIIKYDATLQGPLRLWLRQPRSNGKYGYVVGKDKYGKVLGEFK